MEVKTPFDFINSINHKYPLDSYKNYSSFLTNRFFSYFRETVLIANIANVFRGPPEQQYDFWYNVVSKRKRFVPKWHKKVSQDDNILMVAEKFQLNRARAKEVLDLMSDEDINELKEAVK